MLRVEAAVSPGRRVVYDTELGGVRLRGGDQMLVIFTGANRDGREFDNPDNMEVTRTPNRHLSFGTGPHRCLGSHLARVVLRIAFEELLRRLPDIEPDPDRSSISNTAQVRGVLELGRFASPLRRTQRNRPMRSNIVLAEGTHVGAVAFVRGR